MKRGGKFGPNVGLYRSHRSVARTYFWNLARTGSEFAKMSIRVLGGWDNPNAFENPDFASDGHLHHISPAAPLDKLPKQFPKRLFLHII